MRKFKAKFLFILLFLFTSLVASVKADFVSKAMNLDLANQPYWSKLLHYENNKSIINNQKFFVSKNGKTDLEDELHLL